MRLVRLIIVGLLLPVVECVAQDRQSLDELQATVKRLEQAMTQQEQRIRSLEQENRALKSGAAPGSAAAAAPAGGLQPLQAPTFIDIGMVADVVGTASQSNADEEGNDRIALRHLELVLGHDVDPYTRLDATIAFSDEEDPHVEEGYLTFFDLPGGIRARLGRFFPKVGLSVAQHLDSLDTVDHSLVVTNLFGHDGYSRSGAELSTTVSFLSDEITHDLVAGAVEGGTGGEGVIFGESRRAPTAFARIRNSWDAGVDTSGGLGATFLAGSADEDSAFEVRTLGLDLMLKHHLSPWQRVKFQAEAYLQDRDAPASGSAHDHGEEEHEEHDEEDEHEEEETGEESQLYRSSPVGAYALLDLRFAQRWGAGVRYDYFEQINIDPEFSRDYDWGASAYITFYQSEFARFRGQYQYFRGADGDEDQRFLLQATAAVGKHAHQIQ